MRNSPDPTVHQQREQQFMQHIRRLLDDERLRVDTTRGRRPVTSTIVGVEPADKAVDLKRMMADMDLTDRDLQARMPVGPSLQVTLSQKKWLLFKQTIGRMEVICLAPMRELLAGETPKPLTPSDVQKVMSGLPPALGGVPSTVVLMSTGGFTIEAHELAERRADRTVVMVEPNDAGGWSAVGPAETKALVDLFDPEAEDQKRQRVREVVQDMQFDLLTSGIAADRIVGRTQLPIQLVENELKSYAKQNAGLAAKRLDGRVVLFREGAAPAAGSGASGGSDMPFIDRMKSLFSRKGETEKKIALLAERRAALSQQRDRAYDELSALETKESDLREQFKKNESALARRRITSQLLQLRKDIERRQQLMQVLNQQVNVVSTHLHNLELAQQGQAAQLPTGEEIAEDAEKAEEMLAQLEADSELAGAVGSLAIGGMTEEERALYEELEREAGGAETTGAASLDEHRERPEPAKAPPQRATPQAQAERPAPRRSEPEAS